MVLYASALDPAGPAAQDIDVLWRFMLWAGVAVFVLVLVLLGLALRRSHRAAGGDQPDGGDDPLGRTVRPWLLGGGVVLPAVVVVGVLVATVFAMRATAEEAPGALTVDVVGHQWWWEMSYRDAGVETANELHIPAGEPVRLVLTSADVIHSFWAPALAGKLDALPDGDNVLVIEADRPGTYEGACAEFCGLQHATMNLVVVAHEPAEFQAWLDASAEPAPEPDGDLAARGREVFLAEDCGSCHTVRGTPADGDRAPDLTHVAGRRSIAGGVLGTSAEDLRRWLEDPHAAKEGTKMPAPELSGDDLDAVVAYLEQLR